MAQAKEKLPDIAHLNPKIMFHERKTRSRIPKLLSSDVVSSSYFGSPELGVKRLFTRTPSKQFVSNETVHEDSGFQDCSILSQLSTPSTCPRESTNTSKRSFDPFNTSSEEDDIFASPRCSLFPSFRDLSSQSSSSEESLSNFDFGTPESYSWRPSNSGILSKSFDRKLSVVLRYFSSADDPLRIIGRKIGVKHVDILSELDSRSVEPALDTLFSCLANDDLKVLSTVSQSWRSIVDSRPKKNVLADMSSPAIDQVKTGKINS